MARDLPDGLGPIAEAAGRRMLTRQAPPRVRVEKGEGGWQFSSPYAAFEDGRWIALLADAFGTRSSGIIDHFLSSIADLVREGEWIDDQRYWAPDETEFNAVLSIVSALRPENEAQAAHAAQLAALHLSAMKLGKHAAKYGDERTVAILAKTTRAYGDGMERLARLQGRQKAKTVNQTIQVVYVDQRDQRNVNVTGGVPSNGGQPHQATGSEIVRCSALPSPRPDRSAVPVSGREGQEGLPRSWWGKRLWRSIWRAQR